MDSHTIFGYDANFTGNDIYQQSSSNKLADEHHNNKDVQMGDVAESNKNIMGPNGAAGLAGPAEQPVYAGNYY